MTMADQYDVVSIDGRSCVPGKSVIVEFWGIDDPKLEEFAGWASESILAFGSSDPPPDSGIEPPQFPFQIVNKLLIHKIL